MSERTDDDLIREALNSVLIYNRVQYLWQAADDALAALDRLVAERDRLTLALASAEIGLSLARNVHAAIVMDTPEDEALKAEAVAAMDLSLAQARAALVGTAGTRERASFVDDLPEEVELDS